MIDDLESNADYDVVIVGAGPAGSSCAVELGRAGFRVLLCDKASFPRPKICGETVNPGCWGAFAALGVADEVEGRVRNSIRSVSVTNKKGREVRLDVGKADGRCFFSMGRDVLDDILARAAQNAGVEFRDGTAVTRATREERWRIELRQQRGGEKSSVTAGYLVGADGRNSTVASQLAPRGRVARKEHTGAGGRVGVQWRAAFRPELAGILCLYLFDSGYCGLVVADGSHTNVSMVTTPDLAPMATSDLRGFLQETLWSNSAAAARFRDLEPLGTITKTSPIDPRRSEIFTPHAVLIGDARETVEPFTGEGVRYALGDGMAAARTLIAERNGSGSGGGAARMRSRFRVNRVFSPALKKAGLGDRLISLGAMFPWLSRRVAGTVIPSRITSSK